MKRQEVPFVFSLFWIRSQEVLSPLFEGPQGHDVFEWNAMFGFGFSIFQSRKFKFEIEYGNLNFRLQEK